MGSINRANLKKTIYYLKRNGVRNTWYAAKERLEENRSSPYHFEAPGEDELAAQRKWALEENGLPEGNGTLKHGGSAGEDSSRRGTPIFSIVVPAYRTAEQHLRDMAASVMNQSYPFWELIVADATEDEEKAGTYIKRILEEYGDKRIRYIRLSENRGISENTNEAILQAQGNYIGLLDHDDMLTPDALYEMAVRIEKGKKEGIQVKMLYSDEDKCNGTGTEFYEPNKKEPFNLDLLLSNNYICHFLVMDAELVKSLGLRTEYDGAQDYDLVLRAAGELEGKLAGRLTGQLEGQIVHVPKVLYHWRCHSASTAENPQSKQYAYDAGLRALQDFADRQNMPASAVPLKHVGFYTLLYRTLPIKCRKDLGAVGGRILKKGRTAGGRMTKEGILLYEGLPAVYSGYQHRAILTQNADAVDIRCIQVRKEYWELFRQITNVPYKKIEGDVYFDASTLPEGTDYREVSLALCKALREKGCRILYQPSLTVEWDEKRRNYQR